MSAKKIIAGLLACLTIAAAGVPNRVAPVAPSTPPADTAPPATVPATTHPLNATDVNAWLDGFLPYALEQGKIAGAQVVIVKDGQVLFKKGYGYSDVAAKRVMDPDRDLMRIGSTSKLFTWTAVMQQVQAGKIDLNADINRYLDFHIPHKGPRPITMNDLMRHRGGFEEGIKDLIAIDPKLLKTTEQYLKQNQRPVLFPAGEVPAYSNYGVSLAGYIVQRVSGEPFDDYIERHILAPLSMAHTTFRQPLPANLRPFAAKGYMDSTTQPLAYELVTTAPAGSVATTGADMARFMIAQLQYGQFENRQILRPETARLMLTPQVKPEAGFDTLAHGFFYSHRNGRLVVGHGGDTIVFHTDFNLLPEEKVGIFVSFSSRGANSSAYGARELLFNQFMDRYFPVKRAPTPPAIAGVAEHAAALAGSYETSRRVETGFISLFYLLQQDAVSANSDGTISLSSIENKKFREVAPDLWRELDGDRLLRVTQVDGRRAILDSANPVGVLQATPATRSSSFNIAIFLFSLIVLLATALLWPVSIWLRRVWKIPAAVTGRVALAQRLTRAAAVADLLYLGAWYLMLAPVLQQQYYLYNGTLDARIIALQIAAITPLTGAAVGLWTLWLAFRSPLGWGMRVRSVIVALALVGVVWLAVMGKLISWGTNY